MKYIEVKITTSDSDIDEITGALIDLGIYETIIDSNQTAIEILEKKKEYEWDYVDENFLNKDKEPTITFYIKEDESGEKLYKRVLNLLESHKNNHNSFSGKLDIDRNTVDDSEWMNSYKEHFKSIQLTDTILVKPSWENTLKSDRKKVLKLDPGMAFGTGDHETTSMCAVLMEEIGCKGKDILDIGTGSGILSIVADLLGGKNILGVDVDPIAVEVAIENGIKNNCGSNVKFIQGDLTEGMDFIVDIVVGNLMAEVVMKLATSVKKHLNFGGVFITSGILTEKKEKVVDCLIKEGLEVIKIVEKGEWVAIAARYYE